MIRLALPVLLLALIFGCNKLTVNTNSDPEQITISSSDVVRRDENPFKLSEYVERDQTYSTMYYEYPSGKLVGWKNKKTGKITDVNQIEIGENTQETKKEVKTDKEAVSGPNIVKLYEYPSGKYKGYKDTASGKIFDKNGTEIIPEGGNAPVNPKENRQISVEIITDPPKRLLVIDLLNALKKEGVSTFTFKDKQIDNSKDKNHYKIAIRELQCNEKEGNETRETIVIPNNKVSFGVNVFLMPKNASVLMDVSKKTNVLEYAYEIELKNLDKTIASAIARDRLETTGVACSNFRVRNVFGGEKALEVYPSEEIKTLCQGAPNLKDMTQLRQKVIFELRKNIIQLLEKNS